MNYESVKSNFIKNSNDNMLIHYKVVGESKNPTILFNHGNGNSIEDWFTLGYVDKLVQDYRLILVDGRGFGQSSKPLDPESYSIELITQDFISVLQHLDIKQCHYFGNSRGGSMGFLFAQRFPEYFLSYTLCSAQPFGSEGPRLSAEFTTWLNKGMVVFVDKIEAALGKKLPEGIRATFLKNEPKAMIAANIIPWPGHLDCFYNTTAPCHLIVGGKDPVAPYNIKYVEAFPEESIVKLTILPELGHAEVYWNSAVIAPILAEFVKICNKPLQDSVQNSNRLKC